MQYFEYCDNCCEYTHLSSSKKYHMIRKPRRRRRRRYPVLDFEFRVHFDVSRIPIADATFGAQSSEPEQLFAICRPDTPTLRLNYYLFRQQHLPDRY